MQRLCCIRGLRLFRSQLYSLDERLASRHCMPPRKFLSWEQRQTLLRAQKSVYARCSAAEQQNTTHHHVSRDNNQVVKILHYEIQKLHCECQSFSSHCCWESKIFIKFWMMPLQIKLFSILKLWQEMLILIFFFHKYWNITS